MSENPVPFDTKFTHIKMNHSVRVGKRQPRCSGSGLVLRPIIVRSSGGGRRFPHWHARWTRAAPLRYARVTLEFAQHTRFRFRTGKISVTICEVLTGFVGLISHFLCCKKDPLSSPESEVECRNGPMFYPVNPSGQYRVVHRVLYHILLTRN